MGDDLTFGLLSKMLDGAVLRHRVIANNLANANTPGYQRRVVSFSEELGRAVASRDAEALRAARPTVRLSDEPASRPDGNNVSTERELADLMHNQLLFSTCTQLLSARIAAYRSAITGETRMT